MPRLSRVNSVFGHVASLKHRGVLAVISIALAIALFSAPASPAGAAGPCGSSGVFSGGNTCTYTNPTTSYATDIFTVPAGVTSIHVVLVGGKGGGNDGLSSFNNAGYGGFGAVVIGDLAVTGSTILNTSVGFNGFPTFGFPGGGGGGASDIRTVAGDLSSRLMVAAGGGGGGGGALGGGAGGNGGTVGSSTGGSGGGGSSGGAGGVTSPSLVCLAPGGAGGIPFGFNGDAGSIGFGGAGGFSGPGAGGGGSGGDGYCGGGGGGSGSDCCPAGGGGGGGAGTSFVGTATGTFAFVDISGTPEVQISWTPLTTGTFTVNKVFSPASAASVTVGLSCTGGATVAGVLFASTAAPAVFTVNNIPAGGTTCTALESPVPAGYTSSGCTTAVALAAGGTANCTITNTLNTVTPTTGTFTVNKVFSPASAASVTVGLSCTGGATVAGVLFASTAAPAVFTVNNIPAGGTTCIALESPVPAGYTPSGCTTAVALAAGGAANCTITNTLNTITPGTAPMVSTTSPATAITTTTATLSGNVTSVGSSALTARGIVLAQNSINPNPTVGGVAVTQLTDPVNALGAFSENASALLPGTNYAFVAFATNAAGTSYGATVIFTTATAPAPLAGGPKQPNPAPTQQPPRITKSFNGSNNATVPALGSTATLSFTIANPNTTGLTGVGFVDTMPAGSGLTVVTGSAVGSCGAGIILLTSTTVTLAGATLPASGSCTVSVTVTAGTLGSWTNQVVANANGTGFGSPGAATINVGAAKPPKSG